MKFLIKINDIQISNSERKFAWNGSRRWYDACISSVSYFASDSSWCSKATTRLNCIVLCVWDDERPTASIWLKFRDAECNKIIWINIQQRGSISASSGVSGSFKSICTFRPLALIPQENVDEFLVVQTLRCTVNRFIWTATMHNGHVCLHFTSLTSFLSAQAPVVRRARHEIKNSVCTTNYEESESIVAHDFCTPQT